MFSSLILTHPTLSSVEKLQYLKTSFVGSAAHLLKNTTLTSENFQKAWDALISLYENKRLLVNSALHSLLSLKRMTKESAQEMETLYTNIMQIHRTLETLQRSVQYYDDFFVFITVQRLDSDSVKAWEQHLGSSKESPTWGQFSEFLITRLLSLQAFEKSRAVKSEHSGQGGAKAHYQGKTKDTHSNKSSPCVLCSAIHYLGNCPQYKSKSVSQRLEIIKGHRLCYNYLGPHRVSACRNTRRCQTCGKKHHSTIHEREPSKKDTAVLAQSSSNTVAPSATDAHVHHASLTPDLAVSGVLLATAQVIVISPRGDTLKTRALIDPGSEITLITERIVQRLHLPRTSSSIPLSGLGGQRVNKTKGLTHFTLRSHFNDTEFTISAHILPQLTSPLPSTNFQKTSWPYLDGLILADSNYKRPGRIDLLLGADIYNQIIEEGLIKGDINSPITQRMRLGWIISGPVGTQPTSCAVQGYHVTIDEDLHQLLQQFWELEEVSPISSPTLSAPDEECESHFKTTHSRDPSGRYCQSSLQEIDD